MSADLELKPASKPPTIGGLVIEDRREEVIAWFYENFEDPAQNTPHDSEEGGYLYIWGGPYDAQEEIGDAFPDMPEDELEEIIRIIQSDGTFEWAPNINRIQPEGINLEVNLFEEEVPLKNMLAELGGQLDEIEKYVKILRKNVSMLGHNNPPLDMKLEIGENDLIEAQQNILQIRIELAKPNAEIEANREVVEKAEHFFQKFIKKLYQGLAVISSVLVLGAAKEIGAELWKDPYKVVEKIQIVANTLHEWANLLH